MKSYDMVKMVNYCRLGEIAIVALNYFLHGPIVISYFFLASLVIDVIWFNPWKMDKIRGKRVYSRFFS